ncbi:O-methyltransferase [Olleya sp. Bg11-27]|uniref:O-methyltransferase n=1 Tax=Olleya sp. Bg11-27 TaxID=2058135 RepID=UPI000C30D007|nr:class I SAM-dependent methyltransferase [Olleya sp. Bg11-27]AUC75802.1 methyltransferase [Olleya sp. Bg11-27]
MTKTYQIQSYFNFLKRSTNQHGVHSPFVYDLVTKCFYDKKKYPAYQNIKAYRQHLLSNTTTLEITDLGSGSQVFKTTKRSISKMASVAGSNYNDAKLLYRLTHYLQCDSILELGTSLGIATQALALGRPKAALTTIEGCPNISAAAKASFKKFDLKYIDVVTNDFSEAINGLKTNHYDLVYFDGNHQKEATLQYFETLLPTITNDTVFIFDDIYWSKDMTAAWNIIKQHPKVTVTIDTYKFGFVFFRQEQAKEHFTIRL